jgi:phosphate transport system substrate-binding protein
MLKARTMVILIAVLMLVMPVTGVFAQDQTIVEIAAGNADFSTLVSLVQAAGLTDVLAGEGPFTVFAPTNDAFAAVPEDVVAYLTSEAGLPTLTEILTYHVVSGAVMSADVTDMMADTMQMSAVGGDMLGGQLDVKVTDMGVTVNQAHVVTPDIAASNGVIHVIDSVLLPTITLPEVDALSMTDPITSAGSSTVAPVTDAINGKLADEGYTGATNATTGTGAGFERYCAGELDFSNASRPIRQEEIDICAALNLNPVGFRVGTDALAVVVSASNDFVDSLTAEQLAAAFSTAATWADVDPSFPAEPILRYSPGTDSGTFDYFVEEVFGEDQAPLLNAANLELSENDNVLVQGVEASPYAIGYFGYAYYQAEADRLKILALDFGDGVTEANKENVDAAAYPLARPLFIYSDVSKLAANPSLSAYLNFYLTYATETALEVGYFQADDFSLNLAKLELLAMMQAAAM